MISRTTAIQDSEVGDDRPRCPACVVNDLYVFEIVVNLGGWRRKDVGVA